MEERVARVETHMEYAREDVREIKRILADMSMLLHDLPTKRDLETWRWQWMGIGLAIVALTVGGITGGLSLITHFAG